MKPTRRRARRGMLTSLVKYPKDGHRAKASLWRKLATWIGGGVLVAALVAIIALLLVTMLRPDLGLATKEGNFEVVELDASTAGFRPDEAAVGAAVISVEGRFVRVPLRADNRAGVEKGRTLHVRYTINPRVGVVGVESWRLVP